MYITLYINCFTGTFIPYGLFDSKDAAEAWIDERPEEEQRLYSSFEVEGVHA